MHWFGGFVLVLCYPQYCMFLCLFRIWYVCLSVLLAVRCECILYLFITILPAVTDAYILEINGIRKYTSRTIEMDFSFLLLFFQIRQNTAVEFELQLTNRMNIN